MKLLNGDCLEILKELPDNSVDSLITDPPAGISFMGKEWDEDKGGRKQWISWMAQVMTECMRVMKPGAHGLVWAIPRTSHWTATALEDAGFEVRDVVTHIFGSGFPKSMDISKAIDKAAGAEREVVGSKLGLPGYRAGEQIPSTSLNGGANGTLNNGSAKLEITAPTTPEAKQWEGWGTSLKPASERWILVKKPHTYDLDVSNKLIGELLCRMSSAKFAEIVSMLNQADLQNGPTQDFAQWLADALTTLGSVEQSELMGMFSSPEMALTFLNIGLLWSGILDALSSHGNTFTTEMKTNLTIELKTLNSFLSVTIQEGIILEEMIRNGQKSSVDTATRLLNASYQKLRNILTLIVQSSVTMSADSKANLIQRLQQNEVVSQTAPLSEDYILVRKPLSEKTVASNVLKHGTGGINIDASRIEGTKPSVPQRDLKSAHGNRLGAGDGVGRSGEMSDNTQGRFPANLVLSHNDDCEEVGTKKVKNKGGVPSADSKKNVNPTFTSSNKTSTVHHFDSDGTETTAAFECTPGCAVAALDGQSGILKSGAWNGVINKATEAKSKGVEKERVREDRPSDSGGASRFFYCAKASKKDKGADNTHPTVKSLTLMSYLIKMITPPNGVVLDPFMGSGSTGVAAKREGFKFIGIEQQNDYMDIAIKRIGA